MMKSVFYGWWITLACSLIGLYVAGTIFFGFTAFFKPIAAEFSWSYTQISFAVSLRGLEMGIFAPLVGFLEDYFAKRPGSHWALWAPVADIIKAITVNITLSYPKPNMESHIMPVSG
ncbi:MAG: hypothetical protein PVG69_00415 [Desulfobacterales bacterium]|jgi:hypothetical protein